MRSLRASFPVANCQFLSTLAFSVVNCYFLSIVAPILDISPSIPEPRPFYHCSSQRSPGQCLTSSIQLSQAYPLYITVGLGCTACVFQLGRLAFANPDTQ